MAKVETRAAGASEGVSGRWLPPKLVFVGFMGAGKSTRPARHAERVLGAEALDSDALLEAELGEPIASFFDRHGEAAFREREEALVLEAARPPDAAVVALGGGAVLSPRCESASRIISASTWRSTRALAWERSRESERPLARDRERFFELHARRDASVRVGCTRRYPVHRGDDP